MLDKTRVPNSIRGSLNRFHYRYGWWSAYWVKTVSDVKTVFNYSPTDAFLQGWLDRASIVLRMNLRKEDVLETMHLQ